MVQYEKCLLCGRNVEHATNLDLSNFDTIEVSEKKFLSGLGSYVYCQNMECTDAGFYCVLCQVTISSGFCCAKHITACEEEDCTNNKVNVSCCSNCNGISVTCRNHKKQVVANKECTQTKKRKISGSATTNTSDKTQKCNLNLTPQAVKAANIKIADSIIIPLGPVDISACKTTEKSDFKEQAKTLSGKLADWIDKEAPRFSVDSGHTTFCVSIFECEGGAITILLTHSGQYTYTGEAKNLIQYTDGKIVNADFVSGSGLREMAKDFMSTNGDAIMKFLTENGKANKANKILLPESNPIVYYHRDTKMHFLMVPGKVDDKHLSHSSNAVSGAATFGQTHGCCIKTSNGEPAAYDLDNNNQHHAEMRAIAWGSDNACSLVAMAPTKGCCTVSERPNNCNNYLTTKGLLDCIPKERQTQSGYNEHKKL